MNKNGFPVFDEIILLPVSIETTFEKRDFRLFTEVFSLWQRYAERASDLIDQVFQSSLLRCSHCDTAHTSNHKSSARFQSSLLRCFYCDQEIPVEPGHATANFNPLYWGAFIVTHQTGVDCSCDAISILFTEVLLLWPYPSMATVWMTCLDFNPLYWGAFIVTAEIYVKKYTLKISILFTEVLLLWP